MNKLFACCLLTASCLASNAATPLWLRDVSISPDGSTIAFTYKGDIYTVPVKGGQATRLTTLDSYESDPVWSPDGRMIAFASDRNGNFDVFVMPSNGGTATRLTTASANEIPQMFADNGASVVFDAHIQDPASSAQFPSSRLTELYKVPVKGGKSTLMNAATMKNPVASPDGSYILFEDYAGMEDEWRKHHTSSVSRDIWRYDGKTGKYTNLTARPGEDRNPVVAADNSTVYFLSERDGKTMNVYTAPVADMSKAKAVTSFKTHPVRFLSRAANGTMAFAYDGEIYTMTDGNAPVKVKIDLVLDETPRIETIAIAPSGSVSVSPDGKQIAFTSRGDVFVAATDYSSLKQITDTPEAENYLAWSPDGKTLVYTSERDGYWNLYTATLAREDEPNFSNATSVDEKPLFNDRKERTYPAFSPDGKSLAFIQDRTKLMVMDLKSKKVRQITDGSTVTRRNGGVSFSWSPDSKWILTEVVDRKHDPYCDIAIINVADGKMLNLTQSGYIDESPRWAFDGNAIVFATERYGLRAHASWGSQNDVMIIFLNREAFDRFNLNEEDYALLKDAEKKDKDKKDKEAKDDKDKKGKGTENKADEKKDIVVEPDGIDRRTVRLTPFSSMLTDYVVTKDGSHLYFISTASSFDGNADLWKIDLRKKEPKLVAKNIGASGIETDKDGRIYVLGRQSKRIDPKTDKITPITVSGRQRIDRDAERRYMFDYVKTQERERFYTPGMHGVDWEKMTEAYRKFLPHINNNYDFAEMLSELLGELNVSHTGGRYRPAAPVSADRTASLGLLYDMSYSGNGLKVDEIIAGGPFDKASSKLVPGCVIESVNGGKLTASTDEASLFNNLAGKKTLVAIFNPADGSRWEEVVKPVSAASVNALLYDRWIKQRAADVDRWSNGRLGYVHISSMNDASFRPVYADVLGKYNDREGIVIDIRNNGGGRMHEDIEVMFSGKKYLTQVVRGQETCDMPSRRWNKPSVMLVSQACYSNAHGTPWVYQTMGLGKVVGMPVPGTMTSVNWVTMQDPTLIFGIPVVGYRTAAGNYLENTQLEPDVKVVADPAKVNAGEDEQLKAAVETLLRDIDSKKK